MFSAVAVGLQLELRLEASGRFVFRIARPLLLRSWFSRFLRGSGNLQFKTPKWCCDWSREVTAEVEARAAPPRSPWPDILSGNWEQLSAALSSVSVCLLSGRIPQPKGITILGASEISPVSLHPTTHTETHAHRHTDPDPNPDGNDWLIRLQKADPFALSHIPCATIQPHGAA